MPSVFKSVEPENEPQTYSFPLANLTDDLQ